MAWGDLWTLAITVIGGGILVGLMLQVRESRPLYVCLRCRTTDYPRTRTKGSILIEIILWLCLIVPGLIYTLWRSTDGKVRVCRACGSEDIVPADSPAGRDMVGR